jgi:hypothetical protein
MWTPSTPTIENTFCSQLRPGTHSERTHLIENTFCSLQVEPFDTNYAHELIARELGAPVKALFDSFSPAPVAAASLGQVYICVS